MGWDWGWNKGGVGAEPHVVVGVSCQWWAWPDWDGHLSPAQMGVAERSR